MILWIDAQLSPAIATWITSVFMISAAPLRDIGLRDSTDREIFLAAKREDAIVMTKDKDFVRLLADLGPPSKVIWVTCGNTSNTFLRQILLNALPRSLELLQAGDDLVEIG
jgi:predicted nuclease of predicted toxin-antitoxin system